MKEMNEAEKIVKGKLLKLKEKEKELQREIYKCELIIETFDKAKTLKRTRHVKIERECQNQACKAKFFVKSDVKKNSPSLCVKCRSKRNNGKAITLVKGA